MDGDNNGSDNEGEFVLAAPPVGELELLAEPRKIEQIKIDYAKTSKFVDVKVLKDSIGHALKDETGSKKVRIALYLELMM
jgi:hypothetical protein